MFSENLTRFRLQQDMTQAKLAELVGCHRNRIRAYENDGQEPSASRFHKLAKALNVSMEQFFTE